MNIVYIVACIGSMLSPMVLKASAGGNISPESTINVITNSQVWGCNGTDLVCNYAASAVGDLKDIPVDVKAQQLGSITKPRTILIQFPKIDDQELFTLTLTEPFSDNFLDVGLVNVPMEVLFVSSTPDNTALKGMPEANSMIKIYRRMAGETLWNERGTFVSDAEQTDMLQVTVTIDPNGVASFIKDGGLKAYYLGEF
jgi:hypothetical protein